MVEEVQDQHRTLDLTHPQSAAAWLEEHHIPGVAVEHLMRKAEVVEAHHTVVLHMVLRTAPVYATWLFTVVRHYQIYRWEDPFLQTR